MWHDFVLALISFVVVDFMHGVIVLSWFFLPFSDIQIKQVDCKMSAENVNSDE